MPSHLKRMYREFQLHPMQSLNFSILYFFIKENKIKNAVERKLFFVFYSMNVTGAGGKFECS